MDKDIRIVVIEPGKGPEVKIIPNTLEAMQGVVGGYIEIALGIGKYRLVCNEEGKLLQLPFNRNLGSDYLVGTVFFAKDGKDGEFESLTEKDVEAILALWDRL